MLSKVVRTCVHKIIQGAFEMEIPNSIPLTPKLATQGRWVWMRVVKKWYISLC